MKVPARIYHWAVQLNQVSRYAITTLLGSGIMLIWWVGVYNPVQGLLTGYAARNGSLRTQCANNVSCVQSLRATQQSVAQLQEALQNQNIPITSGSWVSAVMQTAANTGLTVTSFQSDADCAKDWYRCAAARFEFSGTFEQLMQFLLQLSNTQRFVRCKQWSLTQSGDQHYTFSCLMRLFSVSECECIQERKTPST